MGYIGLAATTWVPMGALVLYCFLFERSMAHVRLTCSVFVWCADCAPPPPHSQHRCSLQQSTGGGNVLQPQQGAHRA